MHKNPEAEGSLVFEEQREAMCGWNSVNQETRPVVR